ncbi:MAG: Rep catalytic domain protein [Geminiviridae sp.]|nr:MAG: Rep catalytic domain protein [Geminiviridae sp.]
MVFRIDAKNFFITYPNSTNLPHGLVHQHLSDIRQPVNVYSCREAHENGEFHHHAIVAFENKFNCRNERYFDIEHEGVIYHPNIQACRDIPASNTYIGKDGVTLGDPIATIANARSNLYGDVLSEARDARHFMELIEERDTKNFVLNHDRLESFAIKRWGKWEEPEEPAFANDTFLNVPQSMQDWVNNELNGGEARPKCLIVVGGPGLGKTSWAESLGRHHYWVNRFTAARVKDAKYAILDDFDKLDDERHEFKGFWGSQRRVGVKISNGISGHRMWEWGIPSIWLYNKLPQCLWDETCYERQRSVLVTINRSLF